MAEDVFCKIINGEIDSEVLFEEEDLVVFADANPSAPVHYLVVPKKHIETIHDATEKDSELLGRVILAAKRAADELGISDGYKLSFNVKDKGGQEVPHVHLHLRGGW
ncbi:MAG: HIT domain-containing protein [Candidatus Spechtbacterales bacterium]|nr:HIT domain-containing protein [Candidatus Spechtbacterales bacterium]